MIGTNSTLKSPFERFMVNEFGFIETLVLTEIGIFPNVLLLECARKVVIWNVGVLFGLDTYWSRIKAFAHANH